MLGIARPTCSVVTDEVYQSGWDIPFSIFPHALAPMASSNPSAAGQQTQPQIDTLNSQQESQNLELDFTPDNPNFVRARDNEAIYWSSNYRELSHPNLFTRAVKTRARLIPDLKKTLIKLSTSKKRRLLNGGKLFYDLEPPERRYELRLTGRADTGAANRILMTGCVWIQCSDKYSIWKIKKRLTELNWLESRAWAPVHVYHEPIIAAHSDSGLEDDLYDYRTGTSLGGSFQLHVDIARNGESDSLCGCLCRSRITLQSRVVNESFCRVGGVLRINGSEDVLITTAHGILNYFVVELLPLLEEGDVTESQLDTSDESSDEYSYDSGMEEFLRDGNEPDSLRTDALGYINVMRLQEWEPLTPFDTITYSAQAKQTQTDNDSIWDILFRNFDADYALFRQFEWPHPPRSRPSNNIYMVSPENPNVEPGRSISMEDHEVASPAQSEPSYILLGAQEAIPVYVFPDEVEISVRGVKFKTLKLRAPKVLAQGTSGSWVVHKEEFCGVVIALYQFEPYAFMLPATTVCRDLMDFGARIEAVCLPPTDYDPLNSDLTGAYPRSTTISTFQPLKTLTLEASATQSEPAPIYFHGSASQDTPSSSVLPEYREPQPAHPRAPRTTTSYRPPHPSQQSRIPLATQSPSVGTSLDQILSGSRKIGKLEATLMQNTRLDRFLERPMDEEVQARLMAGRPRNPNTVLAFLSDFENKFHVSGSSWSDSSYGG
ncbi:hypothetical protein F4803DRAFT_497001 [Xylaria telfairii]|nr:hypothetical protein F4803DRAFT_497001 [Xylaria telfairii]